MELSLFLWALVPLWPGLIIRRIFDSLTGESTLQPGLWTLVAIMVGVYTLQIAIAIAWNLLYSAAFNAIRALLSKNLSQNLLDHRGARTGNEPPGQLISHFRDDVVRAGRTIVETPDGLGSIVFAAVAVVIMLRIDAAVTVVAMAPVVGTVFAASLVQARIQKYRRATRAAEADVTGFLREIFASVLAVKVANAEARMMDRFGRLNEVRRRASIADRMLDELLETTTWNMSTVATGIILLLAATAMQAGTFTVGDFALFVYYLGWIQGVPFWVGFTFRNFKHTQVALERMTPLVPGSAVETLVEYGPVYLGGHLPEVSEVTRRPEDRLSELDVTGLTYRYAGTGNGVRDIHLKIGRGTFTVITGRIGSGKTTLLRALLGLVPAQDGETRWNGATVGDPASFFVPPRCAYLPQVPRLFSETLKDNILLGLPEESVDLDEA